MKREELDVAIRVASLDLVDNASTAEPFGRYVMAETHAFYVIELMKRWEWDKANGNKLKIDRAIQEAEKVTKRHFRDKASDELAHMLGFREEVEEIWKEKLHPIKELQKEKSQDAVPVDASSGEKSKVGIESTTPTSSEGDSTFTLPPAESTAESAKPKQKQKSGRKKKEEKPKSSTSSPSADAEEPQEPESPPTPAQPEQSPDN